MKEDFWHRRWKKQEIAFHMARRHDFLAEFYPRLKVGDGSVFVPLCGKSPDLLWIREQGAELIGVELSDIAVHDFFAENGFDAAMVADDRFQRYSIEGLTLLCGDLFALDAVDLEPVCAVYDRGALVALPPEMRRDYSRFLCRNLPAGVRILMVGYDYDQTKIDGPPFSVPLAEVEQLFGVDFEIELLAEQEALGSHELLRQRGLLQLTEYACLLRHRG